MAFYHWSQGDLISSARLNEIPDILNGTTANQTITLTNNAAGTLLLQPASAPALSTQIFKVNHHDATNEFAIQADGGTLITQYVNTSGSPTALTVTGGAHTTLAASTEAIGVNLNLSATVQFATGALTTQRAVVVQAPTYAFVGASTLTNAATVAITDQPAAGANATITNKWALWVQAGRVNITPTVTIASATSAVWNGVSIPATTLTVTGTTAITTATGVNLVTITAPTITDGSSVTITNAATVAITGAPSPGGTVTLTNAYALWVQAGTTKLSTTTTGALTCSALTSNGDSSINGSSATALLLSNGVGVSLTRGLDVSYNSGSSSDLYGIYNRPTSDISGSITNLFGYYNLNRVGSGNSPTVTNAYGAYLDTPQVGGFATLTNSYGVFVNAQSGSTINYGLYVTAQTSATTNYAIFTAGSQVSFTPTMTVASATSAVWNGVVVPSTTLTVTGTTAITTAGGVNLFTITAPTITDSSSVTITNAATVAITGAPTAGGSVTITNAYAFWVQGGAVRFSGVNFAVGTTISTNIGVRLAGTITASSAQATGIFVNHAVTAAADSDALYVARIAGSFNIAGHASVQKYYLNVTDTSGSTGDTALLINTNLTNTTDTYGFVWFPSVAGAQTGVPANTSAANSVAMRFDSTNGRLYAYYGGGWKSVTFT